MSGVTTGGLTMLADPSLADAWLQWWRTSLQFGGALGVVLFAVIVGEPSGDQDAMANEDWGEAPDGTTREAARRIGGILVVLAMGAIAGLVAVGEPLWRAVNHGMSAAATGGFVVTDQSAASSGAAARMVLVATVLVSAVSFGTIWDVVTRTGVPLWQRTQVRVGALVLLGGIGASVIVSRGAPLGDTVFNAVSASTTSGFSAGSGYRDTAALAAVAMVSMLIGGAVGSTAGGIKIARVAWLAKATRRWVPGGAAIEDDISHVWDAEHVAADDGRVRVTGAAALVSSWLALLAVLGPSALPPSTLPGRLVTACSRQSAPRPGVGLSSGLTDASLDGTSKGLLSALMVAGRVTVLGGRDHGTLEHPGCPPPAGGGVGRRATGARSDWVDRRVRGVRSDGTTATASGVVRGRCL